MISSPPHRRLLALVGRSAFLALLVALGSQCSRTIDVECSREPIEIDGFATGYESCGEFRHRATVESCPVFEHQAPAVCADVPDDEDPACNSDADCEDDTFGRCLPNGALGCGCVYGCKVDEDCDEGAICVCGEPFGHCAPATCATDADCTHEGSLCAEGPTTVCGDEPVLGFGCFLPEDECHLDSECEEPGAKCILGHDGVRTCQLPEACVVPPPAE